MKTHKYVGLDVHSDTTMIAVAEGERTGEIRLYGQISSDLNALEKVLRKFGGQDAPMKRWYPIHVDQHDHGSPRDTHQRTRYS